MCAFGNVAGWTTAVRHIGCDVFFVWEIGGEFAFETCVLGRLGLFLLRTRVGLRFWNRIDGFVDDVKVVVSEVVFLIAVFDCAEESEFLWVGGCEED